MPYQLNMDYTTFSTRDTTRGCSGTRNGDIGAVVAPATQCPEAGSINRMKPPWGAVLQQVQTSPPVSENRRRGLLQEVQSPTPFCENLPLNADLRAPESSRTGSEILRKQRDKVQKKHKKTQEIRIASLNIHGKKDKYGVSKYKRLCTLMRKTQIAVLALQETRLNEIETAKVCDENPKILILNNGEFTHKEGVGFAINLDKISPETLKHTVIIKNMASRLQFTWQGTPLDLLTLHVPNSTREKIDFLEALLKKIRSIDDWKNPIVLGDFNFVEDAEDRWPVNKDPEPVLEVWRKVKSKLRIIDGWKTDAKNFHAFTFEQVATGSKSRIDRIYISKELYPYVLEWDIMTSANLSDHSIPYCDLMRKNHPYMESGVWRMQVEMLQYKPFMDDAKDALLKTQSRMKSNPESIQMIWEETKAELKRQAMHHQRARRLKMYKKEAKLKKIIKEKSIKAKAAQRVEERKGLERQITKVQSILASQRQFQIDRLKEQALARYQKDGETCSKYWFGLNKPKYGVDNAILALRNEGGLLKAETKDMLEIATAHHQKLQNKPEWNLERKIAAEALLGKVNVRLSETQIETMDAPVARDDVLKALKVSNNGKVPGADGIPYEFYKVWSDPRTTSDPDIIEILHKLYVDIEEEGIKMKNFNQGIMSLMYKKKEKTDIGNYRPLCLLNTDYKIYTKIIATRLASVASHIIHKDQAGFVPGRSLYDHTKLTHSMIEYCELTENNGCILSLDQEKAYDKIDHEYLWRALATFGFTVPFIQKIKMLYESAKTTIIINGVKSKSVHINRGVRQGDPVSCLLYDIAIEPLGIILRKSKLKGFKIKGRTEKVLASFFADDTLLYLSEKDDHKILKEALDLFCCASTAKFNEEKTEYIPVGSEMFRKDVIENKRIGQNIFPLNAKIVKDGESIRTLGAWVGNNISAQPQWERILDQQRKTMELWHKMNLSYKGKELVLKALVQSRALFLATVNGMPQNIIENMKGEMKDFIWDYKKRGLVKWEAITLDRSQGGLGFPDISLRVEAIQIMWLKKWLAPPQQRPTWAFVVDEILKENITPNPLVEANACVSWALQSWHESMSSNAKISKEIRGMLKVARKYNIAMEAPKLSVLTKNEMPAWHHHAVTKNYLWNKKSARCLRDNHRVSTVGDLVRVEEHLAGQRSADYVCENEGKCADMAHKLLAQIPEKYNPVNHTPVRDRLDHTPTRIQSNRLKELKEEPITFNPDITERDHPNRAIRIFINQKMYKTRIMKKLKVEQRKPAYRKEKRQSGGALILYTDGSAPQNGDADTPLGIGVWHAKGSKYNKSLRISKGLKTNQRAELIAIIAAVKSNIHREMIVRSDSMSRLKGIIERLHEWEDIDFVDIEHAKEWKYLAYLLRRRRNTTKFQWVKGHSDDQGNAKADQLAAKGAEKGKEYKLKLKVPERFQVRGARLQSLTQALAYRLVLRHARRNPDAIITDSTHNALEDAQDEVERTTSRRPTTREIWEKIQSDGIQNKAADFIWKILHRRLKCGPFFANIPKLRDRQYCYCGSVEYIDHILLHCDKSGVRSMWNEVAAIWFCITDLEWIRPTNGIIRALGSVRIYEKKDKEEEAQKVSTHKSELYKIFVSTAMWTTWKVRNKRVIEPDEMSKYDLVEAWSKEIKDRVLSDFNKIGTYEWTKQKSKLENFEALWCRKEVIAKVHKGKTAKLQLLM
jgi:ribonuclease HI/exonuclease III